MDSMASEGVDPDARCYRFAAEAFRKTGDENDPSPEAERYFEIAERLELDAVEDVAEGGGSMAGGGGSGGDGGGGRDSLDDMLSGMSFSGTVELEALLQGAGKAEFDSPRLDDSAA